jgi:anti-sigma factor RsiW
MSAATTTALGRGITEEDLLAYVDCRLNPTRHAEIRALLQHSPQDHRRIAADFVVLAGLRLLFEK